MDIDGLLRRFREVLNASWPAVATAAAEEALALDWLQATWEILVEGALDRGVFLEIYGDGADCNGASSRVWAPGARATHRVACVSDRAVQNLWSPGELTPEDWDFEEFMAWTETPGAERQPPFDCVLLARGNDLAVCRVSEVRFELRQSRGD